MKKLLISLAILCWVTSLFGQTVEIVGNASKNQNEGVSYLVLDQLKLTQGFQAKASDGEFFSRMTEEVFRDAFITRWKTDNQGQSANTQINIPTSGSGYNYTVKWVNKSDPSLSGVDGPFHGSTTINLPVAGEYIVFIKGDFPRIYFDNRGDRYKILSIEQWGNISWTSMNKAFYGCSNLSINAEDGPDLSQVSDMSYALAGAASFNDAIDHWDVSNVTDMSFLFSNASSFNQNLNTWNTGNVSNMASMFSHATAFNGIISSWNVSSVLNMSYMFNNTPSFNQNIGNWDVGNVVNMSYMFNNASSFNQDIGGWSVSSVTNMSFMFKDASSFNQDLQLWNVSAVSNMRNMFQNATAFNGDISSWNVSNVTDMSSMFMGASAFNQDLSSWITNNVTNLSSMFSYASSFNGNIGTWDISNVVNLGNIFFRSAISIPTYDQILIGWAANPTTPTGLNIGDFEQHYCEGDAAHQYLVNNLYWTLNDDGRFCPSTRPFITRWKTDNPGTSANDEITIPTVGSGYRYKVGYRKIGEPEFVTFNNIYTGSMTFRAFPAPGEYEIMISGEFPRIYFNDGGDKEKLLSVEQWGDIEWTSMNSAFEGCSNLVINASDDPDLSMVSDMHAMFEGASQLNQSLQTWNTSTVTDMSSLFKDATNFNQDLSTWNVSSVVDMSYMFENAASFNQNIGSWQVDNVTDMSIMFRNATSFNQNIGSWNVGNVSTMAATFQNASSFDQNLGSWDVQNVTSMVDMLSNSGLRTGNYDLLLEGWSNLGSLQSNVTLDAINLVYCESDEFRDILLQSFDWNINDAGYGCAMSTPFITTWKSDNIGGSADNQITININDDILYEANFLFPDNKNIYSFYVDWVNVNDPTSTGSEGPFNNTATITFPVSGTYQISISGVFPAFKAGSDAGKLISVDQWGDNQWLSMEEMFKGVWNIDLTTSETPDLTKVTTLKSMFEGAAIQGDLQAWNTSSILDMSEMFKNALTIPDVTNWNVENISNFNEMFSGATSFNQDIGSWDISSATNMSNMLSNSGLSVKNYDRTIIGWARLDAGENQIPVNIVLTALGLQYCSSASSRATLENSFNWTFFDDGSVCSGQPFITTWKTDNPGTSSVTQISIPTNGTDYNYYVNWEEVGNASNKGGIGPFDGNATIDFPSSGTYRVEISGLFNQVYFNNNGDKEKILSIEQWGDANWNSMSHAFMGCKNLTIPALDAPDLSRVNDMSYMFYDAFVLNDPIGHWNVSTVNDMSYIFYQASAFNQDITNWDVSAVTNMSNMFSYAHAFDQNISTWDVSNVLNMSYMFLNASLFNQSIDNWNVSSLDNATGMFSGALSFNQNLNNWNTSSFTSVSSMFANATNFNGDITSWDLGNVISLAEMFRNASSFNQDISLWDVSNIRIFANMLNGASSFDQNLGDWNLSPFLFDLSGLLTNTNLSVENYDATLIGWNTLDGDEIGIPQGVYLDADGLIFCNGNIARNSLINSNSWTIRGDLRVCPGFTPFITTWKTDNSGTSASNQVIIPTRDGGYQYRVDWEEVGNSSNSGSSQVFDGDGVIDFPVGGTYQLTIWGDFPRIYFNGTGDKDKILSIDQWGSQPWISMNNAFNGCSNLTMVANDIPNFANLSDLSRMFFNATSFNGNLSNWDVSNVIAMSQLFSGATSFNQDISTWNVSNVTSMSGLFKDAILFDQDISAWDVSNVTFISSLFEGAISFNQDISTWNVDNVKNTYRMFRNATSFNQNIGGWNTGAIEDFSEMFAGATAFDQNLSDWDISSARIIVTPLITHQPMDHMFDNSGISQANYDALLIGWSTLNVGESQIPANIELGAGGLEYCNDTGRNVLINTYNWTIIGDALNCPPPPVMAQTGEEESSEIVLNTEASFEYILYPNPASDFIELAGDVHNATISIFDLKGNEVAVFENGNSNSITIDTSNIIDGVYLLRIQTALGTASEQKLVIKH